MAGLSFSTEPMMKPLQLAFFEQEECKKSLLHWHLPQYFALQKNHAKPLTLV
jgi:hypothetical protein